MKLPRKPTALTDAITLLIERLGEYLPNNLPEPLVVTIAGGSALAMYSDYRTSNDVDAFFSRKVILPDELWVKIDEKKTIAFDGNYPPPLGRPMGTSRIGR